VHVLGGDEVLLPGGGDDHRGRCDAIEASRDAGGGVEERGDGVVVEDGLPARAGGIEAKTDVFARLVEREGREACDGRDALVERVMRWLGESIVERWMTGEDQPEGTLSIEVGDGEEAHVFEGVVGHGIVPLRPRSRRSLKYVGS
jgi:hypothetical protein